MYYFLLLFFFFFFFQAEDGIRDADVTGVQTCALPISVLSFRKNATGLPRSFRMAASAASASAIHHTTLIRLPQPKNRVWASRPGRAARMTQSMTRDVGRALWAWGDDC